MEITDAAPRHIRQIYGIEKSSISPCRTEEALLGHLGPGCLFLAAVEDGRVIGYADMKYVLDEGDIYNVAVDPAFRRQGAGSALMAELARRGRQLGLSFVTLEVRSENAAAIALYKKAGFVPVGLRKKYYSNPQDDAIIMRLDL